MRDGASTSSPCSDFCERHVEKEDCIGQAKDTARARALTALFGDALHGVALAQRVGPHIEGRCTDYKRPPARLNMQQQSRGLGRLFSRALN